MTDYAQEAFARKAVQIAMSAAVRYAIAKGHNPAAVADEKKWNDSVADAVKVQLPEAIQDAADAIACNMNQWAEVTFAASIRLAGISAAKKLIGER